jgi:UDP-N-acetylmuramate dehydrogenase
MDIDENVPLAPLTTLGVGGQARFFARARSAREVGEAIAFACAKNLPLFVLGGGSNVVVSDRGWNGLVLEVAIVGIEEHPIAREIMFRVGAGEDWDRFVAHCVERNCSGLECLSGIPGRVGGTPVQNVGAYGQEVGETIHSVLAFDLQRGGVRELTAGDCEFGYRTSLFNTREHGRYIILEVTYALQPDGKPHLGYSDLKSYFVGRNGTVSIRETRDAVLDIRERKGMLIRPGDADSRSAGSFFKNPVISAERHRELTERARARGLRLPSYPALSKQNKIPAAWLVEHSGFAKGYRRGRAGISTKHALALVNLGGATAAEILALKDQIQSGVEEVWGIRLEPEPVFVGFD